MSGCELRFEAEMMNCADCNIRDEAVAACKVKLSEEDIKYLEEPYQPKFRQGY